jgi:hypothetical protein
MRIGCIPREGVRHAAALVSSGSRTGSGPGSPLAGGAARHPAVGGGRAGTVGGESLSGQLRPRVSDLYDGGPCLAHGRNGRNERHAIGTKSGDLHRRGFSAKFTDRAPCPKIGAGGGGGPAAQPAPRAAGETWGKGDPVNGVVLIHHHRALSQVPEWLMCRPYTKLGGCTVSLSTHTRDGRIVWVHMVHA